MSMRCPKCGENNPPNSTFCAECGTDLRAPQVKTIGNAGSNDPTYVISQPSSNPLYSSPTPVNNSPTYPNNTPSNPPYPNPTPTYPSPSPVNNNPSYPNVAPIYPSPAPIYQPMPPRKSGANPLLIGIPAVLLLLLVGIGGTLVATKSGPFASPTVVAVVPTATPAPTATSLPDPTATTAPQPTDTIVPTATIAPTATTRPTSTPLAATATPYGNKWKVLRGPQQIKLPHPEPGKNTYKGFDSPVSVSDFYASATFYNPYDAKKGGFDYGYIFRSSSAGAYGLTVDSSSNWILYVILSGGSWKIVQHGALPEPLKLEYDAPNYFELLVQGTKGSFWINDKKVTGDLDLSKLTSKGDVRCVTALINTNAIQGSVTYAEEFTIETES